MQANQVPTVFRLLSSAVLGLGALALLALPAPAWGVASASPSPEVQRSRGQQKPATRPQNGKGQARQRSGARPAGKQGRGTGARKLTRPTGQRAKNARDAANAKRAGQSRAKVTGTQSTRAQNARDQKVRAQGQSKAQVSTRAEKARKQAQEGQAATDKRAVNARRQAQAKAKAQGTGSTQTDVEQAVRIKAARDQAASSGISGATDDKVSRATNARRQQAARIGSAERQLTEAQKSTRIANARQKLAGLSTRDKETAKRYLADQESHHRRMARMQRIETLLQEKGDTAGLARVKALRTKELAQHGLRRATLRKQLSEDEVLAIEDTGELGNHPVRLNGQGATRTRAANQKSSGQGSPR